MLIIACCCDWLYGNLLSALGVLLCPTLLAMAITTYIAKSFNLVQGYLMNTLNADQDFSKYMYEFSPCVNETRLLLPSNKKILNLESD